MKRENFYRRSPSDALSGMVGMSLEERGVYNTIVDLFYLTWRPLEDNRAYIAGHCGCAVQKLNPIIVSLLAKKKLLTFVEGGVTYLSNRRFEEERSDVKGPSATRSGRAHVGEKSADVEEKSAGVRENPHVCQSENAEKQAVTPLDKTRVEETRDSVPIGTGGEPPDRLIVQLSELDAETRAWRLARHVLVERGKLSTAAAGKVIGKWLKGGAASPVQLWTAAEAAWRAGTEEPVPYITAALREEANRAFDPMLQPEEWRQRKWMEEHREGRFPWAPQRGPKPAEPGCRVSPAIQREFGVEPAGPQPVRATA